MASGFLFGCVIAVLFLIKAGGGECPSGWVTWSHSCYLLQPTPMEQWAASSLCGLYNATLVSVNSPEEMAPARSNLRHTYTANTFIFLRACGVSGGQSTVKQLITAAGVVYENGYWVTYWTSNPRRVSGSTTSNQCPSLNSLDDRILSTSCDELHRPLCERSADLEFIDKCSVEDGWRDTYGACYKLFDIISSWNDARQQCLRHDGNLYSPDSSPYVVNQVVSCRKSVTHIWLGASDTDVAGTLKTLNGTQLTRLDWAPGDDMILEPGNTCVEAVAATGSALRYKTDVCDREKQFLCQKPYGVCSEGWEEHKGRCYQLQDANTWFLAKQQCADFGAELLVLNSMNEQIFIYGKQQQYNVPSIWLGFSDEMEADVLRWVDGSLANGTGIFGVWASDFPSPVPGRVDCGLMLSGGSSIGAWSHGYCFRALPYICELHIGKPLLHPPSEWVNGTCDTGWLLFQDSCFLFSVEQDTWDGAAENCANQSSHLATVSDPYVQSFLGLNLPDAHRMWIGLKMDVNSGRYYWSNNSEANFTNYLPGEPDGTDTSFYCLAMTVASSNNYPGSWTHNNCSLSQDYICQKLAVQSGGSTSTPTAEWSTRCEPGWRLNAHDNVCYLVMTGSPKSWLEANGDCQKRGAHLLSISGPNEQLDIEAVLGTAYPQYQTLWIGASDSTQEGGWQWSDGSPFRYLHWNPGEPNDQNSLEDCTELVAQANYQWNDRNCDDFLDYICKKPAKAPTTINAVPVIPTTTPVNQCVYGPVISGLYSVQSSYAFSCSGFRDDNHTAVNSRLLDNNNWSWQPKTDQTGEWVGVTFHQILSLVNLTIAGEKNSGSFVSKFKVYYQYSVNAPWYWIESAPGVPQMFEGPSDEASNIVVVFPSVIQAQSIRIYPQEWTNRMSVRFELIGCVTETCSADYALSGPLVVMDGAFLASNMSDPMHTPHDARLHPLERDSAPSCWRTAFDPDSLPWIAVNLGTIKLVQGVTVMGNPDADEYVTLFQLQYRLNDESDSYATYEEPFGTPMNFTGNVDNNSSVTHILKSIISVQQVRLMILAYQGYVALRFDILICSLAPCKDIALLSGKHNVSNSAFSASSSLDFQHSPHRSYLEEQLSGAYGDAWVAKFNDDHQYIQVDLGVAIQIWAVATQGSEDLQQWVRAYTLAFSQDGNTFTTYADDGQTATMFDGNFDASSVRKHYLLLAPVAQYVQLWPLDYEGGIALRWEIYGCPGPDSGQYMGCFLDEEANRDLPYEPLIDLLAHIGPLSCQYHCFNKGYSFAGLQRGIACYCGNTFGKFGASVSSCTAPCLPPYEKENCGGHMANAVYSTGLAAPHAFCKTGWVDQEDSCYAVLNDLHSWSDGQETCRLQGADLVSIKNQVENDYVFSLVVSANQVPGGAGSAWIGLNDLQESYFYQWNDGSEVTYTQWDVNMPVADPSLEQHCVALNNQTGGWKTEFCSERLLSVCKMPKQPSPIPHLQPVIEGCEKAGWSPFRWSCYNLISDQLTWADAQNLCHTFGGHLVQITDRYEQAFVASLLGSLTGYYWTDVTSIFLPSTLIFAFSDLSTITFTAWGPSQPAPGKLCVALMTSSRAGLWGTFNCSTSGHAICEKPRSGYTPFPTEPPVPPLAGCPQDWCQAEYSCFHASVESPDQRLSWREARENCLDQGTELASFHSLDDLETVWRNCVAGKDGNFWIGLYYSEQDQTLRWSDESGVNFLQWASDQSDALQGLLNCGELRVDTGDMAHQLCSAERNWICSIHRGFIPMPPPLLMFPAAAPAGSCFPFDDTWKKYGGTCYHVEEGTGDNGMTWREARAWCNSAHTELVSIGSGQEQLAVQSLIQNVSSSDLWIGLNKLDLGHGFRWSDGSPTGYENWDVQEPNNFGSLEYCVNILPRNGKWRDVVCTRTSGFVCEQASYDFVSPTTPTPSPSGFCPAGYSLFSNKCLRVYGNSGGEQLMDWSRARNFCTALGPGYTLASIGSLEENLFIVTLLDDNQLAAWIGLLKWEGTFTWTDSSEVTFTNWNDGEPSGGVENCVYLKGTPSSAGLWSDAPCGQSANYICQTHRDPQIITPEPIPNPCNTLEGFTPFKAGCFKFMTTTANWTAAALSCRNIGANLVAITDAFSQAFLQLFVLQAAGSPSSTDDIPSIWIGLNDLQVKGAYTWSVGWPITYSNWALEEPSRGDGEGCVSMGSDGLWVDDNCSQQLPYVCTTMNEQYIVFTPEPPRGQCIGTGWVAFGDFCYLFRGADKQNFYEAQLYCEEQNAYLASLHDNVTLQFVVQMLISQTDYSVWIGLYGSQTAGFSWVDHTAVQFTNWADSEPSGTNKEGITEHCVTLNPRTRFWSDLDCDLRLGYVCRKAQELDENLRTRPPVFGPNNSPPTIYQVPQKTPATLGPIVEPPIRSTQTPITSSRAAPTSSSRADIFTSSATTPTKSTNILSSTDKLPQSQTASGLSHGVVAAIVISFVTLAVFGAAILLFFRQRKGQLEPLLPSERSFANILFRQRTAKGIQNSDPSVKFRGVEEMEAAKQPNEEMSDGKQEENSDQAVHGVSTDETNA